MQYPDDTVHRWARRFLKSGRPTETGRLLMTLCFAIHESFAYSRRTERGTQPPAVTLARRRGTCRDFALLMIDALRSLGFAARFVSGYVYVPDRDDPGVLGGGSTHAWAQVYLPGAGWVEFDPTNGIVGNRDLIRVAVARDPRAGDAPERHLRRRRRRLRRHGGRGQGRHRARRRRTKSARRRGTALIAGRFDATPHGAANGTESTMRIEAGFELAFECAPRHRWC